MNPSPLRELVKMELWRGRVPLLRSLIVPATLLGASALRSAVQPGLVLGMCGVALALSAVMVGLQVGRDREDGTLQYLREMPVSGEVLIGARFLAVAVFCLTIAALLLTATALIPEAGVHFVSTGGLSFLALALVLGWVVAALLARYSWTAVISGPVVAFVAIGFLADFLQLGEKLGQWLAPGASTRAGAVLVVVGGLMWVGLGLLATAAFMLGARWLQPRATQASEEALKLLRDYHAGVPNR